METMAASGCIEIKYGMESGSERLLKAMRKNTTQAKIRAAVEMTSAAGISAKVFIIHGYPGRTPRPRGRPSPCSASSGRCSAGCPLFRFVPLPRHRGVRQRGAARHPRHPPAARLGRRLEQVPHPPQHPPLVGR
ncbi:hypothetical protein [Nonomuraea dietziae]|uniref:hypothetical protein n=1 Tax=Nonomuraea dietziae TaxID=65515 RepID=UPI003CD05CBC